MGHSSIQVTVDLYCHRIPCSNRQAVDRLDETSDIAKTEGESATSGRVLRWKRSGFSRKVLKRLEPASGIELPTCGLRTTYRYPLILSKTAWTLVKVQTPGKREIRSAVHESADGDRHLLGGMRPRKVNERRDRRTSVAVVDRSRC